MTRLAGRGALSDTMGDLIVDSLGALATSVAGWFSLKHRKGWVERRADAAEAIEDGVNGFLSTNQTAAFSNRMGEILKDTELRMYAGTEAQRTLCRSWQHVVEEVRDRYSALIAGKTPVYR